MHLGMAECHISFRATVTLTSDLLLIIIVSGAFLILLEIGIPNLECGCILGWWSVMCHWLVTVTLTSDLVFRKIMSGAYLILLKVRIPNLVCECHFGLRSITYHFRVTLTLTSGLVCTIFVSRTYFLNYLRWKSQIWYVDASWDGGVSCTIYGSL